MTNPALQARYPLTQGVKPWLVVVAVMLPTFMEVLDTAIATVALSYYAGSPKTLPPAFRTASANWLSNRARANIQAGFAPSHSRIASSDALANREEDNSLRTLTALLLPPLFALGRISARDFPSATIVKLSPWQTRFRISK